MEELDRIVARIGEYPDGGASYYTLKGRDPAASHDVDG